MFWFTLKHELYVAAVGLLLKLAPPGRYMLFAGEGASTQLCRHIARQGLRKVLIVTDRPLVELGVTARATAGLEQAGIATVVFDAVQPDPDFGVVHAGLACYREHGCDGILAVGGGSSIDAAKVIALAATHPRRPEYYVGFSKLKRPPAPLYAIPTTSGTGSEATTGAIISDAGARAKRIIADPRLLPLASALDPTLLTGLPPAITAATGMDALTHAVEAYIGRWDAGDSMEKAAAAVKLIFEALPQACADGGDIAARDAMAHAAYMAGQAINQVNVGNVHAIAHHLGAFYGVPHGLANAVTLPHVLALSRPQADQRLTELARLIGGESADDFIAAVRQLNARIGIPATLTGLRPQDIPELSQRAVAEGCGYPVPHLMSETDCSAILSALLPAAT